jgi:hypothetical protein
MRSEFLAYKQETSKRMEEIRKRIESFSPPRTSPATKTDRLMPKPQVVLETRTRNKKAEDSTKPPVATTLFFGAKDAALLGRTSERQHGQHVLVEEYKQNASILDPGDIISVEGSGDSVYSGSTCKQGEIEAVVIATGIHTFFGKAAHYAGQDLVPKFRASEPWKKVFGPVFIYHNSAPIGDDPFWLWEDAKIQMMNEVQSWPYSFPAFEDFQKVVLCHVLDREMLEQNVKEEEEMKPRLEGQGLIFAKPEFFLGDKEDVRGEG